MSEIMYNKLVRDGVPQIIADDNQTPITRILDDQSYKEALLEKLVEEARELLESSGDISERVDVAEVLLAIDKVFKFKSSDIKSARIAKVEARGGFEKRVFLEKAIIDD